MLLSLSLCISLSPSLFLYASLTCFLSHYYLVYLIIAFEYGKITFNDANKCSSLYLYSLLFRRPLKICYNLQYLETWEQGNEMENLQKINIFIKYDLIISKKRIYIEFEFLFGLEGNYKYWL